jgi:SAM-dependent methyltransferase
MLLDLGCRIAAMALVMTTILVLAFFPWATDSPLSPAKQAELQQYYATAYAKQNASPDQPEDAAYVQTAEFAAQKEDINGRVARFARDYGLAGKSVLDVGAGRGYLQDIVEDYTALDISPSARRFFHKRFVAGSATAMPLADNEFDAAWTIWVLEHVPDPENALAEMRRVVKPGGLLYLLPTWDCTPWAAQGYPVRPYADFNLGGKVVKAVYPAHLYLWSLSKPPVHLVRAITWKALGGPTRLHYSRLTPDYSQYWMPDADAASSLDAQETALWFVSRGDECLNCSGLSPTDDALIIRVHKGGPPLAQAR